MSQSSVVNGKNAKTFFFNLVNYSNGKIRIGSALADTASYLKALVLKARGPWHMMREQQNLVENRDTDQNAYRQVVWDEAGTSMGAGQETAQ